MVMDEALLKEEIVKRLGEEKYILDALRQEARRLKVKRILPRSASAISILGADGGNRALSFDPFMIQIIRVVDSSNNWYYLEAVTAETPLKEIMAKHREREGTPLGSLMAYLDVDDLEDLSPMITTDALNRPQNPRWVEAYREIMEWAILFSLVKNKDFATDTIIVYDGLLRSLQFYPNHFQKLLAGLARAMDKQYKEFGRHLFLVGVAKKSKVLDRYRLAMALEKVFYLKYPAFVEIPPELEKKAYLWPQFAWGDREVSREDTGENPRGGNLHLVKFGSGPQDPIWPVDIFQPQSQEADRVLGYLLHDALGGFPIPFYPRCLQKAHEYASLSGFMYELLEDQVYEGVREILGQDGPLLDIFQLDAFDASGHSPFTGG